MHDIFCHCCERKLNPKTAQMLEYNQATDTYHANEGEVPEEHSLGGYHFGPGCARRIIRNGGRMT